MRKPIEQILPSQSVDRIQDIDMLRGFALLGVILVNVFYFNVPADYFDSYYGQYHDPVNKAILYGLNWFFNGKFYPIFSFLFGLGFFIQFTRSLQKGVNPYAFLARRLTILLVFGLTHILFVWEEDILFIYAIFGFTLLALAGRSPNFVFCSAVILYFIPVAYKAASHFAHIGTAVPVATSPLDELVRFYTTASYGQILQQRIAIYLHKFSQLEVLVSQLDRLAFFLLGFYVGRKNYVATFAKEAGFWFRVLLISFCIFGASFLVDKIWLKDLDELRNSAFLLTLEDIVVGTSNLFQILLYIIGFLLLLTLPAWRRFFTPLAGIGRTALTVYLAHTTVFSFLFYSFGFRLYSSLDPTQLFIIAISFFFTSVVVSLFWLNYFHYGPLEWVWRSLTYGKVLPFIKLKG